MNKILLFVTAIVLFAMTSCGNEAGPADATDSTPSEELTKEQLVDSIQKEETKMRSSQDFDPRQAMSALRLYTEYCNRYPDDTATAEYLFRASDIAQGTGNYQQAAELLETILEKHPGYRNYVDACFSAALVYDNYLENVNRGADRAIELYDFIIEKYPNSYYAEQAKVLKTYVGKPDSVYYNDLREKMKTNQ